MFVGWDTYPSTSLQRPDQFCAPDCSLCVDHWTSQTFAFEPLPISVRAYHGAFRIAHPATALCRRITSRRLFARYVGSDTFARETPLNDAFFVEHNSPTKPPMLALQLQDGNKSGIYKTPDAS
ncbi:hypothetical protein [Paraburkholderia adhaesiva]|uniref:hypothetical protein n=1 Tax=Paraburkholderia adhaesiva TaxID=2883244 RepID=UPI001F3F720D|nr:hypothetical protein [Paraburkholderia adhaesiva]